MRVPYSAIYVDIEWKYIFQTFTQFVTPADRQLLELLLQNLFLKNTMGNTGEYEERMLLTASVRTGFDLVLQALNLPLGSEIIMTSINIPDMVKIIRNHGLIPVPVDISDETLGPTMEDFQKAFTERTKLIMTSFLYGAKFKAAELYDYAHSKGCFVFEDQAESFTDIDDNGSKNADCTLFSFGTIKPFTSYGGGVVILRNQEAIYRKSRQILSQYPMISNATFFKKVMKNMPVILGLNYPIPNTMFRVFLSFFNYDYKSKFVSLVRGFQPKDDFLETFRLQMPTPMMALLYFRLRDFNSVLFQMQVRKLTTAQNQLLKAGVKVPGSATQNRAFWLYPILTENPKVAYQILNERGIDAYLGATQLDLVESPMGFNYKYPSKTKEFFQKIIYLPIHRNVPEEEIEKVVQETIRVCKFVDEDERRKKSLTQSGGNVSRVGMPSPSL